MAKKFKANNETYFPNFGLFAFFFFFIAIEDVINCQEFNIDFFCSQIRSRDFGKTHYFLDIVINERDFQEGFCDMVTSAIDLDISLERTVYLSDYNIRFD